MKESTRVFRFILIGTFNALITAFMVWLMMEVAGVNYLLANVVAYLVAQTHNFVWSKYWIFPLENKKSSTMRQVLLFTFAVSVAYISQFVLLLILVETFHLNEYLAQLLGLILYGFVNFTLNRCVTFT